MKIHPKTKTKASRLRWLRDVTGKRVGLILP